MTDAAEMLELAARAARERRDELMPKRGNKPHVAWEELGEDVRDRWREAMTAVREELGLNELWAKRNAA